ncbi:MAG: hypothetical protein ACK4F6_10040 [Hylemonella sp.]
MSSTTLAAQALRDHIQKLAGKVPPELQIESLQSGNCDLVIYEDYAVQVEEILETMHGRVKPGNLDALFVEDGQKFDAQTKAARKAALNDPVAREQCLDAVRGFRFGQHVAGSDKVIAYTPAGKYFLHATCSGCDGKGIHDCPACYGSGESRCTRCGGMGWDYEQVPYKVGHSTHYKQIRKSCGWCHASGTVQCGLCAGHRTVNCKPCGATGSVTTTYQLSYSTQLLKREGIHSTPRMAAQVKRFVDDLDLSSINSEFTRVPAPELEILAGGNTIRKQYIPETVWSDSAVRLGADSDGVVIRQLGNKHRIIDSEGLLDLVIGTEIDRAAKSDSKDYLQVVADLAAIPMCNKVVQLGAKPGTDAGAVAAKLHQAVSTQRIQKVIDASAAAAKRGERVATIWGLVIASAAGFATAAFTRLLLGTSKGYVITLALVAGYLAAWLVSTIVRGNMMETVERAAAGVNGNEARQAWEQFVNERGMFASSLPLGIAVTSGVITSAAFWLLIKG